MAGVRPSRFAAVSGMLVAAGILALTTGCSSGQVTQTSDQETAIAGINANKGDVALRDAFIGSAADVDWEKDMNVPVSVVLTNEGTADDVLLTVESPDAASVIVASGELPDGAAVPSEEEVTDGSSEPTPTATSPVPSESGSVAPSPESSSDPAIALPLTPGGLVRLNGLGESPRHLLLVGVHRTISPGDDVRVTFHFERSGRITLRLPVAAPSDMREREKPSKKAEH